MLFLRAMWLLAAGLAGAAQADDVRVAVAANFTAPMQQIAAAFEQDTGHHATLAFGSTGKFYAQIKNGAPFQLLLAADEETPKRLAQEGAGVEGTRFTYAIGKLALWSRQAGLVDEQGDVLRHGTFAHIALADPKLAPYGKAAVQTLTRLGLHDALSARFVLGENIAQAHQFVATGNAPLGFVALSQVFAGGRIKEGSAWIVPAALHEPIRQDALVLDKGRDSPTAAALMQYLRGDKARAIIRAHGYDF